MLTLVIDNFDSFVFNLVQYIGELGGNPQVFRNNEITLKEIRDLNPSHILLSPGPGNPEDPAYFGICADAIKELGKTIPLLGVCLGHQGIGSVFGAKVVPAPTIMHGKTSLCTHDEKGVFKNLSNPLRAMRYHSLCISPKTLPECLEISATSEDGTIMGVRHKTYPIHGIQFHPESIGTPEGKKLIQNFLDMGSKG
ncbi:MAG: aminodeoxychorismate/anthranilate synthase component II [Candidatus Peregrinibacteria bacterium]